MQLAAALYNQAKEGLPITRILLAEDDKNLNRSLTEQLIENGFEVDCCFDGEDALYYAAQKIHDVILLDRMLPFLDGASALKKNAANSARCGSASSCTLSNREGALLEVFIKNPSQTVTRNMLLLWHQPRMNCALRLP